MDTLLQLAWVPLVTALIGWFTNWVAVRMLFRPRRARRVLPGVRWQGLMPRRQPEIAARAAEIVERELLSQHAIRAELQRINLDDYLEGFVRKVVHQKVGQRLARIPVVGGLVSLGTLERVITESLRQEVGPLRERLAADVEKHLQVRRIVEEKITAFDLEKLEAVVMRIARREFRAIEILGGVLGFVVGLVQLGILYALGTF